MDISVPRLLSEMAEGIELDYGPEEFIRQIAQEFVNIGPQNPLRKLDIRDKARLLLVLVVYWTFRDDPRLMAAAERAAQLAADARKLAMRIESEARHGALISEFPLLLETCEDLQAKLGRFSRETRLAMELVGKQGHKQKNLASCLLITASEFVRQTTGSYNDEHLAELCQGKFLGPRRRSVMSGDAIRKKRDYLQKEYPELYATSEHIASGLKALSIPGDLHRLERMGVHSGVLLKQKTPRD